MDWSCGLSFLNLTRLLLLQLRKTTVRQEWFLEPVKLCLTSVLPYGLIGHNTPLQAPLKWPGASQEHDHALNSFDGIAKETYPVYCASRLLFTNQEASGFTDLVQLIQWD